MSRHGADAERVVVARLCGTATRHAREREVDEDAAVSELRAIATEHIRGYGPRLRVDLLSVAAGTLIGSHRYSPTTYWSAAAAGQLLIAAGADEHLTGEQASATLEKLERSSAPGIGSV